MEPIEINAVVIEWEFRCHGKEIPGRPWDWRCRSREGLIVAASKGYFRSLREAIADAASNGFVYETAGDGKSI